VTTVAIVLPTSWDRRQLAALRAGGTPSADFVEIGPDDADVGADFDPDAWLADATARWRGRLDGVFSSSDYPGAVLAAALARELGLPGPAPAAVLAAAHKGRARAAQQELAPANTPRWQAIAGDADELAPWPWPGPAFCKPIKGAFSRFARRVDDLADLRAHLRQPALQRYRDTWLRPWRRLLQRWAPDLLPGDGMLVEEVVGGQLVTAEGFVAGDEVCMFGIVDSRCHPETGSFLQFDYPSALPPPAQAQLMAAASAAVRAAGLRDTLCNVELFWDRERERAWIVEVNPRLCGQFGDLYQRVDGVHSYELAARIAAGEPPRWTPRQGRCGAAASVPLRLFAPCRVIAAPGRERIEQLERQRDALIWSECATGDELADLAGEDGHSVRYAVLNVGGEDRAAVTAAATALTEALDYQFERLGCC
jgi:biotin carboxylase